MDENIHQGVYIENLPRCCSVTFWLLSQPYIFSKSATKKFPFYEGNTSFKNYCGIVSWDFEIIFILVELLKSVKFPVGKF